MGNLSPAIGGLGAACYVNGAAATPVYGMNRGFSSAAIVDTGTGDQTLTLNNAMDLDDESFLHATIAGTTSGMIAVEIVSTTQIRVRTFSGADAAADKAYWISIWPVGPD